jgi:hypothetical protein
MSYKIRPCLWLSDETCSYICMYINAVADSVVLQLYLWHEFCNIVFEVKKLYVALGSGPPPPQWKKLWVRPRFVGIVRGVIVDWGVSYGGDQ